MQHYFLKVYCDYPCELAKESDSETETVGFGNGIGDDMSITDDDNYHYMLRKILRTNDGTDDISLDLSFFADDRIDDGSVASVDHYGSTDCSHYCGSGGHSIQSSSSSNHRRSSSCSSAS